MLLFIWIGLFVTFQRGRTVPIEQSALHGNLMYSKQKEQWNVDKADLGFYYIEDGKPKGIVAMLYHFEKAFVRNTPISMCRSFPVQRDDLLLHSSRIRWCRGSKPNHYWWQFTGDRLFGIPWLKTVKNSLSLEKFRTSHRNQAIGGKEVWIRAV